MSMLISRLLIRLDTLLEDMQSNASKNQEEDLARRLMKLGDCRAIIAELEELQVKEDRTAMHPILLLERVVLPWLLNDTVYDASLSNLDQLERKRAAAARVKEALMFLKYGDDSAATALPTFTVLPEEAERLAKHERAISALLWAALQGDNTVLYGIGEEWTKPEGLSDE